MGKKEDKEHQRLVDIEAIANLNMGHEIKVKTKIHYSLPIWFSTPEDLAKQKLPPILKGILTQEETREVGQREALITGQRVVNEEVLANRRNFVDDNVLHCFHHHKPKFDFVGSVALNVRVDGTLRKYISRSGATLFNTWFGSSTLTRILREALVFCARPGVHGPRERRDNYLIMLKRLGNCKEVKTSNNWSINCDIARILGSDLDISGELNIDVLEVQIVMEVSKLHQKSITLGNRLSVDSVFYVQKDDRPIIKLDWRVEQAAGVDDNLDERKRGDWKELVGLVNSIEACIAEYGCTFKQAHEYSVLKSYLLSSDLDLTSVENYVLKHPAFWFKRRVKFIFKFVNEFINGWQDDKYHRLIEALELQKDSILPINCGSDWVSQFDPKMVQIMEHNRIVHMARGNLRRDSLDSSMLRHEMQRFRDVNDDLYNTHKYDETNVVDYLQFMRNYLSHHNNVQAIPHAIALVKAADKKSPREAVEFVLQLLKYNDNSGNPYLDVFWLSALVQSFGELEFGQQNISFLSSLLKRIDRLLQFDSLVPSHNGILTIHCIRTLAQIALKMSSIPLERISELIKPFRDSAKAFWEVRIEASKVLLDLEFYCRGLDAALSLFMKFLVEEPSLRGEAKLAGHAMNLCQANAEDPEIGKDVTCPTLVALLRMLASKKAFNNVLLRHYLFCILQILAERPPTLYGVPKIHEHSVDVSETFSDQQIKPASSLKLRISSKPQEPPVPVPVPVPVPDTPSLSSHAYPLPILDAAKEADTVSNCSERKKNVLKIKVKQPGSSSKAEDTNNLMDTYRGVQNETNEEAGPASSVSVDAPNHHETNEISDAVNPNIEEANSYHDFESQMTASIGSSAKLNKDAMVKELECTADSKKHSNDEAVNLVGYPASRDVAGWSTAASDEGMMGKRKKEKKKDTEKKRKREEKSSEKDRSNNPEYLERKRQKKEKKRLEKELAKRKQKVGGRDFDSSGKVLVESSNGESSLEGLKKFQGNVEEPVPKTRETSSVPRLKIKIRRTG